MARPQAGRSRCVRPAGGMSAGPGAPARYPFVLYGHGAEPRNPGLRPDDYAAVLRHSA